MAIICKSMWSLNANHLVILLATITVFFLAWNQMYFISSSHLRSEIVSNARYFMLDSDHIPAISNETQVSNFRSRFKYLWTSLNPYIGLDSLKDPRKFMIYRCGPGMLGCGGWADRVKGMITGYILANLTGRVFKIDFRDPYCDITNALIPNKVDWRLPKPFHKIVELSNPPTGTIALDYVRNPKVLFKFENLNLSTLFNDSTQYVYMKANLDHMEQIRKSKVYSNQLSWMTDLRKDQLFAEIYKRLFQLSPNFQQRLDQFMQRHLPTPDHKLVCAHIRMGRNPNIPQSYEQVRMQEDFLPNVWSFISNHSTTDKHKIFIMSDSNDTMVEASRQPFASKMVHTPGTILHIEYARDNGTQLRCDALEKVIFDQAMLINCDVLLISKSGLSRMAAFVRGSDDGLFCLFPWGTISKCRSDEFTKLYHITG